jgi:hypothetical protein
VNFAAKDSEGDAVIAYSSVCGPASPQNAMLLLKYNQQMVHGAFAVHNTPAGEMVVVQANQLADTADPLAVTRLITAVAWQADKAEEKLTGGERERVCWASAFPGNPWAGWWTAAACSGEVGFCAGP